MACTIQIRVDDKLKTDAEKLFKDLGTDVTTAVRMFLTQAVACERFPFEIRRNPLGGIRNKRSESEEEIVRMLSVALSRSKNQYISDPPQIGIAKGILESPVDLDKDNDEIESLFGGK